MTRWKNSCMAVTRNSFIWIFAPCFWIDSLLSIIWNNSSFLEIIM